MANKKKLLILISTITAMAASALVAVVSLNRKDGLNGNSEDLSTSFAQGYTHEAAGSDELTTIGYINDDPTKTINIKMEGITLQQVTEEQYYMFSDAENYTFIYNLEDSPIRGISDLNLYYGYYMGKSSIPYVRAYIYYSYFPLTIDNILNGQYQDLKAVAFNTSVNNVMENKIIEGDLNARYFLIALSASNADLMLFGLIAHTPCDDDPPEITEKGNYPHTYGEDVDAIMPNDFPFIGNGSFVTYSENQMGLSGYDVIGLQRNGKQEQFFEAVKANGYQKVSKYMTYDIYQKPSHDDLYYTVVDVGTYNDFDNYEILCFAFMGETTSLLGKDSWPIEDITSFFGDADFADDLTDIGLSMGSRYHVMNEEASSEKNMSIQVTFPDNISIETAKADASALTTFENRLETLGYFASGYTWDGSIDAGSYNYAFRYEHPTLKYRVILQYSYSRNDLGVTNILCAVVLTSYSMSNFPTDELIEYFEDDYFPAIPGTAKYRVNTFTSGDSMPMDFDIQRSKRYITSGLSNEDRTNYLASLETAGWTVSESTAFKVFSDTSLPFGARVRFRTSEYFTEIIFETGVASAYEYYLDSALERALRPDAWEASRAMYDFRSAVSSVFGSRKFYYSNTGELSGTIICTDMNQFVVDAFLERVTYNDTIGQYIHHNGSNEYCMAIACNLEDDIFTLNLSIIRYSSIEIFSNLVDSATVNAAMDELFNNRGISSDLERYHVNGEGEIFNYSFGVKSDNIVSVVLDNNADLTTIRNGYINALTSAGLQYSSFLERYVDTSNGVGVAVSEIEYVFGRYIFQIGFTFGNTYRDYVSYDDLDLSEFHSLDLIQTLDVDDNDHFVVNYVNPNNMNLYMDPTFYESYRLAAKSNGYSGSDSNLVKVDEDGDKVTLRFYDYEHSVTITVDPYYYRTKEELADNFSRFNEFFSNFILPAEGGKKYHCDQVYEDECELYVYNVDLDAFRESLVGLGFENQDGEFAKVSANKLLTVRVYSEFIRYRIANLNTIPYSELLDTLTDSYGVDERHLDRFVVSESFGNNVYIQESYGSGSFLITIVDSDFDLDAYKSELEAAGFQPSEKEGDYESSDHKTIIWFRSYYGLTQIEYNDRREFYDPYETVVAQILANGMSQKRLSFFVAPEQEEATYQYSYGYDYSFQIKYNSDTFDTDAYLAKLDASEYTLESTDSGFYNYVYNDARINVNTNSKTIYYYNSTYFGLTFEEVKGRAVEQGFNSAKLANLVDPGQSDAEFDSYVGTYENNIQIRWLDGRFDSEAYRATLVKDGYVLDENNSSGDYYVYKKAGYCISINDSYREIEYRVPMNTEEMLAKAVEYGFDSLAISRLVLPDASTLAIESFDVYSSHELYLFYAEDTVNISEYKSQVEAAGYVFNEYSSSENYFYYENDGSYVAINTESHFINVSLNYTFDEIRNCVLNGENREWFNDFVDPEQENAHFSYFSLFPSSRKICLYYNSDFDPDAYIEKLLGLGYENIPDTSVYSNDMVQVSVYKDANRLDLQYFKTFSEIKDEYLSNPNYLADIYNALIDPEQNNVGYAIDYINNNEIHFTIVSLNSASSAFNKNTYEELLLDNEFTSLGNNTFRRGDVVVNVGDGSIHIELYLSYDGLINTLIDLGYVPYEDSVGPTSLDNALFNNIISYSDNSYQVIYVESTFDVESYCDTLTANGYTRDGDEYEIHLYNDSGVNIYIYPHENRISVFYN